MYFTVFLPSTTENKTNRKHAVQLHLHALFGNVDEGRRAQVRDRFLLRVSEVDELDLDDRVGVREHLDAVELLVVAGEADAQVGVEERAGERLCGVAVRVLKVAHHLTKQRKLCEEKETF